jgi:hypothetical protein
LDRICDKLIFKSHIKDLDFFKVAWEIYHNIFSIKITVIPFGYFYGKVNIRLLQSMWYSFFNKGESFLRSLPFLFLWYM